MSRMVFDYIILGAGSAGTVLANRLSADPEVSVCLIEAGPQDRSPLIHIPSCVGTLLFHKTYGWGLWTEAQQGAHGRRLPLPRGRVLGGSSSTNGMAYFRGHPKDFDEWAEDMGCPGWRFEEVLPYFKRSENNVDYPDSPWHGNAGEMHISHVSQYNPMIAPFLDATQRLGYPRCEDFNASYDPIGFDIRQNALYKGRRVSGASAFLKPVQKRPNLHIVTDCFADRVVIDQGRATGVDLRFGQFEKRYHARREVLVCGGAYGSPAILMHSGIGPAEALSALGIQPILDLPGVGRNLHDHPSSVVQMVMDNSESYGISWPTLPRNALSVLQYLLLRRGQLAGNLFEVTGFLRTTEGLDRPDVQFVFMPANRPKPGFPFPVGHGFGINSILLRPKSRGTVKLASADPNELPLIDTNFLGDDADLEPLLRGIRIARQIIATPEMAHYEGLEVLPGNRIQRDDEIRDYIRSICSPVHHPGGSCKMGSDDMAVVDPELKVRGIAGLRVVDASIFPRVVSGNTNAPTVMVAEKAADLIRGKPPLPAFAPD